MLKDLNQPLAIERRRCALAAKAARVTRDFKSATNQAPREFTRGEAQGEKRAESRFELKVDRRRGTARQTQCRQKHAAQPCIAKRGPEIADYPFTTKHSQPGHHPNRLRSHRWSYWLTSLGLIEGAHAGVGLGHEFLRHVERTRVCWSTSSEPLTQWTGPTPWRTIESHPQRAT